jgi:hypothetical protein
MTPSGLEPATSRFVAQNLNHCDTAVPNHSTSMFKTKELITNSSLRWVDPSSKGVLPSACVCVCVFGVYVCVCGVYVCVCGVCVCWVYVCVCGVYVCVCVCGACV